MPIGLSILALPAKIASSEAIAEPLSNSAGDSFQKVSVFWMD